MNETPVAASCSLLPQTDARHHAIQGTTQTRGGETPEGKADQKANPISFQWVATAMANLPHLRLVQMVERVHPHYQASDYHQKQPILGSLMATIRNKVGDPVVWNKTTLQMGHQGAWEMETNPSGQAQATPELVFVHCSSSFSYPSRPRSD